MGVSKRTRQKEMRKNAVAVLILIAFTLTIFSVNSIGKFIAEKIIKPVADFSGIKTENQSIADIKTDPLELYAVLSASFDNIEEAQTKSEGKYIFKIDGKFNVLHSIKTKKEDAQETASSFDGAIITLKLDGIKVKITGTKTQTDLISSCFKLLTESAKTLPITEENLQQGTISPLQAEAKISSLKTDFSQKITAIKALESSNTTVTALCDMLNLTYTLLNNMPSSNSADFIDKLKYTSCACVCEYFNFLSEFE